MNDYIYRGDALAVVQHSRDPVDGIKQLPGITLGTPDNEQIRRLVQDLRDTQSRSKRQLLDTAADTIEELQAQLDKTRKAMEYHRGRAWYLHQKYEVPEQEALTVDDLRKLAGAIPVNDLYDEEGGEIL